MHRRLILSAVLVVAATIAGVAFAMRGIDGPPEWAEVLNRDASEDAQVLDVQVVRVSTGEFSVLYEARFTDAPAPDVICVTPVRRWFDDRLLLVKRSPNACEGTP